jgi:hypothetical protein
VFPDNLEYLLEDMMRHDLLESIQKLNAAVPVQLPARQIDQRHEYENTNKAYKQAISDFWHALGILQLLIHCGKASAELAEWKVATEV